MLPTHMLPPPTTTTTPHHTHHTVSNGPVLYVSAEESVEQVAQRATRLSTTPPSDLLLLSATSMHQILQHAATMRPHALVVDSIQTVYLSDVNGSAGSVQQVRECSAALLRLAKEVGCPVFVVGHVTKVCLYVCGGGLFVVRRCVFVFGGVGGREGCTWGGTTQSVWLCCCVV